MTYEKEYRMACRQLQEAGIKDARIDAWILLEHITHLSQARFWADGNREMPTEETERFHTLISKRLERIPVQHLTGHQEFMGIDFLVNPSVLVPRQDTEILVEQTERILKLGNRVLDICTGSGCIAVSLAVRNPNVHLTASDISWDALELAEKNAQRQSAKISFIQSDMFSKIEEKYDVIVSNPPYIPTEEIEKLADEVRLHDPFSALDGKEDGLYFYRILAKESPAYLKPGGFILMEIGYDQGCAVKKLFKKEGFMVAEIQKDLSGLDRVVSCVYNKQ